MKQRIYLKRKPGATFKSLQKGLYPDSILKITKVDFEPGEYLVLHFKLFAHSPLEQTPIGFSLTFDKDEIPEIPNSTGDGLLDYGHPPLSHLLDNYLDFDEHGVYLTNVYGKMWFLLQDRNTIPNGLNEKNLFENWEFMTDTEIDNLIFKEV